MRHGVSYYSQLVVGLLRSPEPQSGPAQPAAAEHVAPSSSIRMGLQNSTCAFWPRSFGLVAAREHSSVEVGHAERDGRQAGGAAKAAWETLEKDGAPPMTADLARKQEGLSATS